MQFTELANPSALAGLGLIVPIVILYLLKPRPKKIRFPTVMFIQKIEKKRKFSFIPKRFVQDPLLLIQLLILAVIVLALAGPMISSTLQVRPEGDFVLVLDASASMQATDVSPTRFLRSVDYAKNIITDASEDSVFSIVLAGEVPFLVTKETGRDSALLALDSVSCMDTSTEIADSIIFAKDLLNGKEDRKQIYVFSDFAQASVFDIEIARKMSLSEDVELYLVGVSGNGGNIAVTSIDARRFTTDKSRFYLTAEIENFIPEDISVSAALFSGDHKIKDVSIDLGANSETFINIENPATSDSQELSLRLYTNDVLSVDDTGYAVLPSVDTYSVLLLTDGESDNYLEYALDASPSIKLQKAVLPVIPDFSEFDLVIHAEIKEDLILPGMYDELKDYVLSGGNLIIVSSDGLHTITDPSMMYLLPVTLKNLRASETTINDVGEHAILKDTSLPEILVKKYYLSNIGENATQLAAIDGNPMIGFKGCGGGRVLYVGLNPNPDWSEFYYSSSMPIFWHQATVWLASRQVEAGSVNFRTGDFISFRGSVDISDPGGDIGNVTETMFKTAGIYKIMSLEGTESVAVNLADRSESNLSSVNYVGFEEGISNVGIRETEHEQNIWNILIVCVLFILVVELHMYLRRGYFS